MKRIIIPLLLFLNITVSAKNVPPSPGSYVHNDGVLSPAGARDVGQMLSQFEKSTGHQFVVAAFQSLEGDDLQGYVNKVFRTWKIGDKQKNDGLLFAMFLNDRKWRVEVGYGLEGALPDIEAGRIATESAVPFFKKGDYDTGVKAVVASLQSRINAPIPAPSQAPSKPESPTSDGIPTALIILFFMAVGGIIIMVIVFVKGSNKHPQRKDLMDDLRVDYIRSPAYTRRSAYVPTPMPTPIKEPTHRSHSSDSDSGSSIGFGGFGGGFGGSGGGFSGGGGSSGGGGASGGW